MNAIIPSRITEAREARALSMGDLADSIGVTRQSVSKYERGIICPSIDTLQAISCRLGFPIEFFYKEDIGFSARSSSLFFRSNNSIAKKVKTACKYQIKWADEIKKQLEHYVDFVDINIPTIDTNYEDLSEEDIEELALTVRHEWGLGDYPLKDLIGILENQGIIVSQFATNEYCGFKGVDAFSSWQNGTPYIPYHSIQKSAVRTRFSILHELGHLIMHSSISDEDSIKRNIVDLADRQADRFAAAFLLPSTSFPKDIHSSSLASLEIIKSKWGAAILTIIKRCESLELLTENQLNYLKRQMTTKKYWYHEPLDDEITIDGPEILRDAIILLIDNNIITKDAFLNLSALVNDDLRNICALPNDFFDGIYNRHKPILRMINPSKKNLKTAEN